LPNEIANKKWLKYAEPIISYEKTLSYRKLSGWEYDITTTTNKISIFDDIETVSFSIDSVIKKEKKHRIFINDNQIDHVNFKWDDKIKGMATWSVVYKVGKVRSYKTIHEPFFIPENFPKKKSNKITITGDHSVDMSLYSEIIEDLPIKGNFACDYKENGNVYKEGELSFSNKNITQIKMEYILSLQCDVRKIKEANNKYALFYSSFYTKYSPPEGSEHYSKTQPIAEIKIIDNNTLEKKWIGFYNKKTKKIENGVSAFDWGDKYCKTIERQ